MAPSWQSLIQKEKVILKFHLRNELLWLIWVTRYNEINNGKLGKKKKKKEHEA